MIGTRLGGALPALGCAALALAFQQVDRLPDNLDRLHEPGFVVFWLARELMPALVVAAVVLVVLRLASRDMGSLARRPLRFALLIAGGGALGVGCAWALALAGGWLPAPGSADSCARARDCSCAAGAQKAAADPARLHPARTSCRRAVRKA